MFPELSLIVFGYNEEACLEPVLTEILEFLEGAVERYELIFVNDGSSDGTGPLADRMAAENPHLRVIHHTVNKGIGAALRTGFGAVQMGWVSLLPADGQIAPDQLTRLFDQVQADTRLVIAHYPRRFETADNLQRKVLSRGLRVLLFLATGVRQKIDGCYLIQRDLLESLTLRSQTFFLNLELPIRAIRSGAGVGEAALEVRPRMAGESKVLNTSRISMVARELLKLRLNLWLGR